MKFVRRDILRGKQRSAAYSSIDDACSTMETISAASAYLSRVVIFSIRVTPPYKLALVVPSFLPTIRVDQLS